MNKNGLTYYVLSASIAVIIIMVLLQPFGIDRIQDYKYLIILGYGVLTAVALLISESLVSYVFRIKRDRTSLKHTLLVNVLVAFIMGFFISCYSSIIFSGNIKYGFFNDQGELVLRAYFINCLYTIIISFFLFIFFYFKERSAFLAKRLQDEIELNKALERKSAIAQNNIPAVDSTAEIAGEERVLVKGNTKEFVEFSPSSLLFIESEGNYVNFFYLDNEVTLKKTLRCTLKQVEDVLTKYPYIIRCHRAFIVNVSKVKHVDGNAQGYRLHLNCTDRTVLVSRAYASSVYNIIEA